MKTKIVEVDIGDFSDEELLAELKIRGYFVDAITELEADLLKATVSGRKNIMKRLK